MIRLDKRNYYLLGLILSIQFWTTSLIAQAKPSESKKNSVTELEYNGPDTSFFRNFTIHNQNEKTTAVDTFLHEFENYAHEKNFDNPGLNLGNYGSATLNILYEVNQNIGNDLSFNQYDLYHASVNNFKFYELNTAYNDLFFSPVGGQSNFLVKAKFSRNFKNKTNIALDYQRINQEGFYSNQANRITSFGLGLWNQSENGKRNTFFRLIATNNNEEHNGGVSNLNEFGDEFNSNRFNIGVVIPDANSRLERFKYIINNFLELSSFIFKHTLSYQHGFYKYADDNALTSSQPDYYGHYLTETRGLRVYYGSQYLENDFSIAFQHKNLSLSTGIEYGYKKFDLEAEQLSRNDLFLYGDLQTDFGLIAFKAKAKTGLLDAAGNFLLNAKAELPISKWFQLNGGFVLSRYNASINQSMLAINHLTLDTFNNDWNKITASQLFVTLEIPKTKTYFKWTALALEDVVFLNSDKSYEQFDGSIIGTQLSVIQNLSWKFIHFNNSVHYQTFDDNPWHLPSLYSRHELYVKAKLFKRRLDMHLGGSLSFTKHEEGVKYFPLLGDFYPSERTNTELYPYSEIFANFKIDDFRVFIKFENALDYYLPEINYQVEYYPQFDFKFRIGVGWFLKD